MGQCHRIGAPAVAGRQWHHDPQGSLQLDRLAISTYLRTLLQPAVLHHILVGTRCLWQHAWLGCHHRSCTSGATAASGRRHTVFMH